MHPPTDRIAHTTAFVTPVVEHWLLTRNSSMGPLPEGSIRWPIAPWANALTTELHLTLVLQKPLFIFPQGAIYSSVVRVSAHDAMGRWINPSWPTHWSIFRSSQCSMTGATKAVVCAILSVIDGYICLRKNIYWLANSGRYHTGVYTSWLGQHSSKQIRSVLFVLLLFYRYRFCFMDIASCWEICFSCTDFL